MDMKPEKVDLGCGHNKVESSLGVEQYTHGDADIVFDLENNEWPLPSNHFSEIYFNHCLEHLENWKNALKEVYRIAEPSGKVVIRIPHFAVGVADPDHETYFNFNSLEKFCTPGNQQYIGDIEFKVVEKKIYWRHYQQRKNYDVLEDYILNPLGILFEKLANSSKFFWVVSEFPFWFGGFSEIKYELEVVK